MEVPGGPATAGHFRVREIEQKRASAPGGAPMRCV